MATKSEIVGKYRNVHCRTWNMARKLKIMKNEKHPLDDLKNVEITKGKGDNLTFLFIPLLIKPKSCSFLIFPNKYL